MSIAETMREMAAKARNRISGERAAPVADRAAPDEGRAGQRADNAAAGRFVNLEKTRNAARSGPDKVTERGRSANESSMFDDAPHVSER